MDDHTHFLSWGVTLASVDLRDAATPEEFIRRIGAFAKTLKPGEWVLGGNWDHERFPGAPLPRKEWVDSVTPNNPVMVDRYDGHMIFANSAALKAAGVDRSVHAVPGGEIVRGPGGEPTGIFRDAANDLIGRAVPAPSESQMDSAAGRAIRDAAEHGVTGVSFVTALWPEIAALKRAKARGTLTLRVSAYPPISDWRNAAESLRVNGPGDAMLRLAGVKGMVDGSLGSTTAWFFQPFSDAPSTTGLQVTNIDSLRSWIARSDSAGLQVVVHAIGDHANAWLLDVFDSVAKAHGPRDRRFQSGERRLAELVERRERDPVAVLADHRARNVGPREQPALGVEERNFHSGQRPQGGEPVRYLVERHVDAHHAAPAGADRHGHARRLGGEEHVGIGQHPPAGLGRELIPRPRAGIELERGRHAPLELAERGVEEEVACPPRTVGAELHALNQVRAAGRRLEERARRFVRQRSQQEEAAVVVADVGRRDRGLVAVAEPHDGKRFEPRGE